MLLLDDDEEPLESDESLDESLELEPEDDFDECESDDRVERIAAATAALEWANNRSGRPPFALIFRKTRTFYNFDRKSPLSRQRRALT